MKVEIHFQEIRQTMQARDAGELLHLAKQEAARRAPFLLRGVVNSMSDIKFAQEAVKRANAAAGTNDALPNSADEFLAWGRQRGYVTVLEP